MKPLALVTGGSRGVGRAIVERMAGEFRVVFTYRQDADAAAEVCAAISAAGGEAFTVHADLADPGIAAGLVAGVLAEHGDVSMVVGNAGVASRGRTAADTEDAEYLRLFHVHALSNVALVRTALPSLRRNGGGAILVSSVLTDLKPSHTAPYTAAKAALEAIAVVMAREERSHHVRINVVAPSLVATDMGDRLAKATLGVANAADLDCGAPLGRVCRPSDVADAVAFLASTGASYITGHRLVVDGGGPSQSLFTPDTAT